MKKFFCGFGFCLSKQEEEFEAIIVYEEDENSLKKKEDKSPENKKEEGDPLSHLNLDKANPVNINSLRSIKSMQYVSAESPEEEEEKNEKASSKKKYSTFISRKSLKGLQNEKKKKKRKNHASWKNLSEIKEVSESNLMSSGQGSLHQDTKRLSIGGGTPDIFHKSNTRNWFMPEEDLSVLVEERFSYQNSSEGQNNNSQNMNLFEDMIVTPVNKLMKTPEPESVRNKLPESNSNRNTETKSSMVFSKDISMNKTTSQRNQPRRTFIERADSKKE